MLTKILFTLAVLAAGVIWLKTRGNPQKPRIESGSPKQVEAVDQQPGPPKLLAAIVLSIFVVMTGLYLFLDWQRANEQVVVRVINTGNGDSTEYLARQADVNGRQFKTIDGRTITLADTERMEVTDGDD